MKKVKKWIAYALCVLMISTYCLGCAGKGGSKKTEDDLITDTSSHTESELYPEPDALAVGDYEDHGFVESEFNGAKLEAKNAGVEMIDANSINDVSLSSSTQKTTGSISASPSSANRNKTLKVASVIDFEVGQGIAIDNMFRVSNTTVNGKKQKENYTWHVDVVDAIDRTNNIITLKYGARVGTHSVTGAVVKHDNHYSFIAISNYFSKLDYVSFYVPNGVYESLGITIFKRSGVSYVDGSDFEQFENGGAGTPFNFSNKKFIDIDFNGSTVLMNNKFHMGADMYSTSVDEEGNVTGHNYYSMTWPAGFMTFSSCYNVSVKNLIANGGIGTSTKTMFFGQQSHGFVLTGVSNALLSNVDMSYFLVDGLTAHNSYVPYTDPPEVIVHTGKVTIRDSKFNNNSRCGISVVAGDNFLIDGCEFRENGFCGTFNQESGNGFALEFEQTGAYFENFVVKNTAFINNRDSNAGVTEHGGPRSTKLDRGNDNLDKLIFDGCLFYNTQNKSDNHDIFVGITDMDVVARNSMFVRSGSAGTSAESINLYNYEGERTVTFENNTIIGHFRFYTWSGYTYFYNNRFFLDEYSSFHSTHSTYGSDELYTKPYYADGIMNFNGDFFYFSDRATVESCFNLGSPFQHSSGSLEIGGYSFKDVTFINKSTTGMQFPDYMKDTRYGKDIYASFDNVAFYGLIKEQSSFDVTEAESFYTDTQRSFSTIYNGSAIKVTECVPLTESESMLDKKVSLERNRVYKRLTDLKLSYTVSESFALGTPTNPIKVSTAEGFAAITNDPTRCYILTNDIYFTGEFTPIADFSGILNGNGYTLYNITITRPSENYFGIFKGIRAGRIYRGTVKNLRIKNLNITGNDYIGGLAGTGGNVDVINCSIENANITGSGYVGGFFGYSSGAAFNYCHVFGSGKITGDGSVGGFSGGSQYSSNIVVENSSNKVDIKLQGTGGSSVGGLLSIGSNLKIYNSYADCNIETAGSHIGGLIGRALAGSKIERSYFSGEISGSINVGGLVGSSTGCDISESYVQGTVEGNESIGGILGASGANIYSCFVKADIICSNQIAGGIAGGSANVEKSYFEGNVTGKNYLAGILGYPGGSTISECYSKGSISGTGSSNGGLVGRAGQSVTIINSFSECDVYANSSAGGLVGDTRSHDLTIINSYFAGTCECGSSQMLTGGVIGWPEYPVTVSSVYYITQVRSVNVGTMKTVEELQDVATYEGWDFESVWNFSNNSPYPELIYKAEAKTTYPDYPGDEGSANPDPTTPDSETTDNKLELTTILIIAGAGVAGLGIIAVTVYLIIRKRVRG